MRSKILIDTDTLYYLAALPACGFRMLYLAEVIKLDQTSGLAPTSYVDYGLGGLQCDCIDGVMGAIAAWFSLGVRLVI